MGLLLKQNVMAYCLATAPNKDSLPEHIAYSEFFMR